MAAVYVDTREFEYEHGRQPRGRGGWLFQLKAGSDVVEPYFAAKGTYAEARKQAVAAAAARGCDLVRVLS